MSLSRRVALLVLLIAPLVGLSFASAAESSVMEQHAVLRPNIVVILADDLDLNLGSMDQLTDLRSMFAESGTVFSNAFVSESLCCPSRASIQRGQFVHNHEILGNRPPNGGFEKFHALKEDQSTVATWLQAVGYRTAFMGKYLNGYPDRASPDYVPPGWDRWVSPAAGNPYTEFDYTLNDNHVLIRYQHQPQDYLTDVIASQAVEFVREAASAKQPFFLFVAPFAPHRPATPAPRHASAFPHAQAPRLPSFDEANVNGKPKWIQKKPRLDATTRSQLDELFRRRLQSMLAVQDLVAQLLDALKQSGQWAQTYVFFTSDNGFHLGEHRLHAGKLTAYEEDIHVPLYVLGPGVVAGAVREEIVGNVDLAPTFADIANAPVPEFVDGRSLLPLLSPGSTVTPWRSALLVEQEAVHYERRSLARRVLEPLDPFESQLVNTGESLPAYAALRTVTHAYIAYETGEKELYDLRVDPFELNNLAGTESSLVAQLDTWLRTYRICRGDACRQVDAAEPRVSR